MKQIINTFIFILFIKCSYSRKVGYTHLEINNHPCTPQKLKVNWTIHTLQYIYLYKVSHQYCHARDQDFWYKGAIQELQLNTSCTKTLVFSWSESNNFAKKIYTVWFFNVNHKKPQIHFFTFSLLLHSTPWLYID